MKILLTATRIFVGVLFIFSGLVKANDPLGLSYKMQEFFEVWGWTFLNDFTLSFSVIMIAFEIIAGVAVLLGWHMKLFSWLLLLLIIFFTFLTSYAVFSGKIRTCGCFGDCIPLKSAQSFAKDLILLVLIIFIFIYQKRIKPLFIPLVNMLLLILATLFSFGVQGYTLKHLPVADCLPFKVGNNITEKMKIPAGAIPDSSVISFVYVKNGQQVEFTSDHFPADFDDSIYHFVKRYDKLIRQGNAEPAIKDFVLTTPSGNDSTLALMDQDQYQLYLFTSGIHAAHPAWESDFLNIRSLSGGALPLYFVTNDFNNVSSWLAGKRLDRRSPVPLILKLDFVALKTAARANPTLYLIHKGNILKKWSYADFDQAYFYLKQATYK